MKWGDIRQAFPNRWILFVGELPKSSVGKVVRRLLREPYWTKYERRV
jgi:acyl-CoA synthetase (AMP-forming)/AMP-acid ligase II